MSAGKMRELILRASATPLAHVPLITLLMKSTPSVFLLDRRHAPRRQTLCRRAISDFAIRQRDMRGAPRHAQPFHRSY